jgi:hypothetical protein
LIATVSLIARLNEQEEYMPYDSVRGPSPRLVRRTRWQRFRISAWQTLRMLLVAAAAFGPSVPPPPPPPPQTVQAKVNKDSAGDEEEP